jgi:DNA-binding LytR/AlgR family response regulator
VTHVEAHGDYARLHTAAGSHLIRVPLTTLEEEWAGAGFVRIHRSLLVALGHVSEIRMESGRCTVAVGPREASTDLVVSRRHTRELREMLGRR